LVIQLKIEKLDSLDEDSIRKIALWYFDEWNTPINKTIHRLSNQPSQDTLFQLVLYYNSKIVATGGLCNNVNIYKEHSVFKQYRPWVGLLYTKRMYRKRGFGTYPFSLIINWTITRPSIQVFSPIQDM